MKQDTTKQHLWAVKCPAGGYVLTSGTKSKRSAIAAFVKHQCVAWHLLHKLGYRCIKMRLVEVQL